MHFPILTLGLLLPLAGIVDLAAQAGHSQDYRHIPAGALSIIAEMRAKPGKEAALRALSLPLIDLVRGDPANLVYFLQEDRAAPGRFFFYEVFATEEDFEAHNNMPYVKAFLAQLPNLTEQGVRVTRMTVLPAKPRTP